MNQAKKAYCRIYQTVLRTVLPVLPYRKPQLLDDTDALPALFRGKGVDRVLMVTDKIIRQLGITGHLEKILSEERIKCVIYDGTVANPTTDNVEEARSLYINEKCQAIIGFGGGSSIDCAKAVGARIAKPEQSLAPDERDPQGT